ncbi:unnamed protein product [Rhizophagus irregularis]|nr:unnamed protein product [Rhizophagus irregularis]
MTDFLITLSRDFANIMEDSDEYNVLIKVGADENDEKSFHAHSLVLRARSPYFKTALSNNWAKKENDITVFYKPNISPYIFELILKFMYAGEIAMDQLKGKDLLKLLTGLQLKSDYLQTPRYNGVKSSIIDKNHAAMLCSWIDGVDSTSIPNLTNYNGDLPYELRLLCKGSRDGFSASIFHDLCDNQGPTITCLKVNDSKHVIGGYNPLSWGSTNSWRNTRDAFIFQFNIYYKKNLTAKIGRVITNSSAYAVNDSQSTGPCFGDGDLWLRDQFNQPGNCSCNKESYDQSVGDMFHRDSWESWTGAVKNGTFAVEDYEVFQVIRKRINNT